MSVTVPVPGGFAAAPCYPAAQCFSKMFGAELKELEMNGFIKRTMFTGIPVVVEYELATYSNTLQDVMQALSAWGAQHRERIRKGMQAAIQHKN